MLAHWAFPLYHRLPGNFQRGMRFPSTKTHWGCTCRASTARFIAKNVACKMLTWSISSALAQPMPQCQAFS